MNNKILRIVILLLIFLIILISIPQNCTFAAGDGTLDFSKADDFLTKGKDKQGIKDLTTIGKNFSAIGKVLVYIGSGVLVAGMGYLGIMYMISGPDKRGKLKQQLIGLVVAGIVIFGAYSIWAMLVKILSAAVDGGGG